MRQPPPRVIKLRPGEIPPWQQQQRTLPPPPARSTPAMGTTQWMNLDTGEIRTVAAPLTIPSYAAPGRAQHRQGRRIGLHWWILGILFVLVTPALFRPYTRIMYGQVADAIPLHLPTTGVPWWVPLIGSEPVEGINDPSATQINVVGPATIDCATMQTALAGTTIAPDALAICRWSLRLGVDPAVLAAYMLPMANDPNHNIYGVQGGRYANATEATIVFLSSMQAHPYTIQEMVLPADLPAFTAEVMRIRQLVSPTQRSGSISTPTATVQVVSPLAPSGEHAIQGQPSLTADQIDQILRSYNSPAAGSGRDFYHFGQQYGIDPAYALAFFVHESGVGTSPGWAGLKSDGTSTHNIGNIICAGYATCYHGFRDYPSWSEGIADWYKLISTEYITQQGAMTVEQIIPIYAPSSENDVPGYIQAVNTLVQQWRHEYANN